MCDVAVIFDFVLELVFFDEVVELSTKPPRLVDIVDRFFIREDIVNAAGFSFFLMTTLKAFVLGLRVVSRRSVILICSSRPHALSYL